MNIIKKVIHKFKFESTRFINKRHAYDYQDTNGGWIKNNYPIMPNDCETYYDPYLCIEGELVFLYVSNRNKKCIYRYQFTDCLAWNRRELIVQSPNNNQWNNRINRLCAVYKNSQIYVWYTGQNDRNSSIGCGKSIDGKTFSLYEYPVLIPENEYEGKSVMNPCVIWDNEEQIFKMWYSAGEQYEPDVICYATSKDGVSWEKNTAPVLTKSENEYDKYKVGGCDVHKTTNGYVMYYIGYQNLDNARICKAVSIDGINWKRSKCNPIISPSKSRWDSDACYKPAFYYSKKENKSYIFYNGRKGHTETIGFAYKEGNDLVDE